MIWNDEETQFVSCCTPTGCNRHRGLAISADSSPAHRYSIIFPLFPRRVIFGHSCPNTFSTSFCGTGPGIGDDRPGCQTTTVGPTVSTLSHSRLHRDVWGPNNPRSFYEDMAEAQEYALTIKQLAGQSVLCLTPRILPQAGRLGASSPSNPPGFPSPVVSRYDASPC
ncbi:hypothetical protein OG21DRAFT_1517916 [Imleria badia]|nr:hypothetical protein OG21DRAFT_1517916 [Imleria badia]